MAVTKMRKMTVGQAENHSGQELYVMNNVRPSGNLNLNVTDQDGTRVTVVIPATAIPVDMSLFVGKKELLANRDFRRLHAKDSIFIVHPDDAALAIESNPRAKAELKRLLSENSVSLESTKTTDDDFVEMKLGTSGVNREEVASKKLDPFVVALPDRIQSEDPADLLADLENRAHTLTVDDLEYVAANVNDPAIKQFVSDLVQQA